MSKLIALARVLADRILEIDQELSDSENQREWIFLWRNRTGLEKVRQALCPESSAKKKPG